MAENLIFKKLEGVKDRFEEVGRLITEPDVISDMKRFVKLSKEYKELELIVRIYEEYKSILKDIDGAKDILAKEKRRRIKIVCKVGA